MKNKFLSVAASTAIVASALVFTGCGDSDSSSSTSSTGGTPPPGSSTASFLKGKWAGIKYYSDGVYVGQTGANGNFSYTANGNQTLAFDLGLMNVTVTNVTAAIAGAGTPGTLPVDRMTSSLSGTTVSTTEIKNLATIFGAYGINETATTGQTAAEVAAIISAVKNAGASLGNFSTTDYATDAYVAQVNAALRTAGSSITNSTQASTYATNALANYYTAKNALISGSASATFPFNATTARGVNLSLADGRWLAFNYSSNAAVSYYNGTTVQNNNSPVFGAGSVEFTGSADKFKVYLSDKATRGTTVQFAINNTATAGANSTTISAAVFNLSNINASSLAGKTINASGLKIAFPANFGKNNSTAVGTQASVGAPEQVANVTVGSTVYNNVNTSYYFMGAQTAIANDSTSAGSDTMQFLTADSTGTKINVAFEADPTLATTANGNLGVVANVLTYISSAWSALTTAILNLFS